MPEYIVKAVQHRVVKRVTEDGETRTESTIYRKGDKVTLKADDAERLVKAGGLVPVDQADSDEPVPGSRLPGSTVTGRVESPGALSGQTAEEGLREASKPSPEALEAHQAAQKAAAKAREAFHAANEGSEAEGEDEGEGEGDEAEDEGETPEDGYDDLEYPALQAECRKRDLPHSGKKADLIERLRAHDQG